MTLASLPLTNLMNGRNRVAVHWQPVKRRRRV
jgi:hypothetical protein